MPAVVPQTTDACRLGVGILLWILLERYGNQVNTGRIMVLCKRTLVLLHRDWQRPTNSRSRTHPKRVCRAEMGASIVWVVAILALFFQAAEGAYLAYLCSLVPPTCYLSHDRALHHSAMCGRLYCIAKQRSIRHIVHG